MYEKFIKPFTLVSKCFVDKNDKSDEPKEDFTVIDLDHNALTNFKTSVDSCMESEDFSKKECEDLCNKKNLYEYKFPVDIFSAFRVSFRIIFEAFTSKDADEFY